MSERAEGSIQSVRKALQLLQCFSSQRPQWSVGDLARATGMHKSAVTRLMATMARDQFVVQDPTSRIYGIGPQAFAVGSVYQPRLLLEKIGRQVLADLMVATQNSTSLGVPAGDRFIIIMAIQSQQSIRISFEPGEQPYYHASAIGKVLLAGMTDEQIRAVVGPDPLPKVTPQTILTYDELMTDLNHIRRTGIAISHEESIPGVGGLAAGIRDATGAYIAGIGVAYPVHLVTDDDVDRMGQFALAAGNDLSAHLGGPLFTPQLVQRHETYHAPAAS
jgi:IclR family acetate operon transcriptional repressor